MRLKTGPAIKANRIFRNLREAILKGRLKPGTRLRERDLAAQLGVSRTPIREAFHQLAQEGHLRLIPHVGAYVNELSLKDLFDVYELRRCLEPYAARLAAERLTPGAEADLRDIRKTFEQAKKAEPLPAVLVHHIAADRRLHQLILDIAGNRRIAQVISNLTDMIQGFRHQRMRDRFRRSAQEHLDILDALLRRDAPAAEVAMVRHLDRSREDLEHMLLRRPESHTVPLKSTGTALRRREARSL